MNEMRDIDRTPKIKVIGVGGAGNNAVNRMIEDHVKGVTFYMLNTETGTLKRAKTSNTLQIGIQTTRGLGAGANEKVGERAAIENKEEQYDIACMVFDQKLSVRETEKLIKKLNNKETPKKKIELDNKDIYADFEEKLKQSMGTKVSINRKSNTKGKIEIEYYSETELERIIGMMLENS